MKFVVNGVKYEFDEDKVTFAEARAVEKVTGRTMAEVMRSGVEDVTTMQAIIWVAMKRADPTLKFADLDDTPVGDVEFIPEDEPAPAAELDPPVLDAEPPEGSTPSE
jgi:hypothetical protein